MAARPFVDTLNTIRVGELHDELTTELNALVAAVCATGRKGELTLKLSLKPTGRGQIEIVDEVKTKVPALPHGSTIFFATPENNLQREDPRQMPLKGLQTVDTSTGEIRNVA